MKDKILNRLRVVTAYEDQASKSTWEIHVKTGLPHRFCQKWVETYLRTGDVVDNPRSGRKRLFGRQDALKAKNLVLKEQCLTAADIMGKVKPQVSVDTVRRELHRAGLEYAEGKWVPMLSSEQMDYRVEFSKKHYKTPWRGVMFTDSKYFRLSPSRSGAKLKYWGLVGTHTKIGAKRDGRQLHVYAGASAFGLTRLHYATGTTGMKSSFKRPNSDESYRGVCAQEYQKIFVEGLLPDGNLLFLGSGKWDGKWIYQQDGARIHTTDGSLKFLRSHLGNRLLEGWPANSPDLSWIENIWAIVDRRLRQSTYTSLGQFKEALEKVWSEVDLAICQNAAKGMSNRLKVCIARNGGHIGK